MCPIAATYRWLLILVLDINFPKAFLMTYKSFVPLDELFNLLVARFRILPPEDLTQVEREEWAQKKQRLIQMRSVYSLLWIFVAILLNLK